MNIPHGYNHAAEHIELFISARARDYRDTIAECTPGNGYPSWQNLNQVYQSLLDLGGYIEALADMRVPQKYPSYDRVVKTLKDLRRHLADQLKAIKAWRKEFGESHGVPVPVEELERLRADLDDCIAAALQYLKKPSNSSAKARVRQRRQPPDSASKSTQYAPLPTRHPPETLAILAGVLEQQVASGKPIPIQPFRNSLPDQSSLDALAELMDPPYLETRGPGYIVSLQGLLALDTPLANQCIAECDQVTPILGQLFLKSGPDARHSASDLSSQLTLTTTRIETVLYWLDRRFAFATSVTDGWAPSTFSILENARFARPLREMQRGLFPRNYNEPRTGPITDTDPTKNRDAMSTEPVDIAIITVRQDEFEAVLEQFPGFTTVERANRRYNISSVPVGGKATYRVAVVRQMEQGNGAAQALAIDIINHLSPSLIAVVGIAGTTATSDVSLGDVVISTRVDDFRVSELKYNEDASFSSGGGAVRPHLRGVIANLAAERQRLGEWEAALGETMPALDMENAEIAGDDAWRRRVEKHLKQHFPDGRNRPPRAREGRVASSDALVKDPTIVQTWLKTGRDIRAIEMESAGIYQAGHDRNVATVAIRGLSDIVGLTRDEAWTAYACKTAAAFARAFLNVHPVPVLGQPAASTATPRAAVTAAATAPDNWRPPGVRLQDKSNVEVDAVQWRISARSASNALRTRTSALDAARASTIPGTHSAFPRPLTLPQANVEHLSDGSAVFSHPYATASNHLGSEHFTLANSREFFFQRDSIWNTDDVAFEFSLLADDIICLCLFARAFFTKMDALAPYSIGAEVRMRPTPRGMPALFWPNRGVRPRIAHATARCAKSRLAASVDMAPPASTPFLDIVEPVTHLLDTLANDFTIQGAKTNSSNDPFMSIDPDSVATAVYGLRDDASKLRP